MRLSAANASAIGLLRVLLAAALIVPIALFAGITFMNYRAVIETAHDDLERISEVASENAEEIFDSQTQLAERVNDLTMGLDADDVMASEGSLHETLSRLVARLPHVASIMIASKSGKPLVSAEFFPVPRDVDLRNRDFFRAIMGGEKGPYISRLQVGSVYRKPFFGLARPWNEPDGTVKGVIDVAVSPAFFAEFYRTLVNEDAGNASGEIVGLIREDGQILSRYPPISEAQPRSVAWSGFLGATRASPSGGVYTGRSADPGSPLRLFAYRKVRGYSVYVVAGRSWNPILAEWRWSVIGHLMFGIPATLALFAVTRTALVRTQREEQALLRANLEIQRREAAEDALLRSQRLEAVGQMTGGVAHDFNNLLTVIAGNAALIDKRADDPAASRRFAANIRLAAQRGADITQHLLAFAGRQTIRPETIDLNGRLLAFKPLLDRAANESVQISLDPGADLRPVRVDPGQFEAAMLNLVGNARDAMPEGGWVRIATRNVDPTADGSGGTETEPTGSEPRVRITVADTGIGMDRETLAKAFEPFFTTKAVGKGTGLGLSQVYGFARQAGGNVQIMSSPHKGTSIEITLPAATEPPRAQTGESQPLPRGKSRKAAVLVVEDEPSVLELAIETLRDLGYVTVAATDARTALEQLRQTTRIDVLFTDVVMPGGMNGLQLSTEAKRLRPEIKVLLTSGHTRVSSSELPGDIPLLPKPYDRHQLAVRIEAVLCG